MKKKQSKKDILRQWGLPEKFQWSNLRYKNPYQKGIYWYYFSIFIRERDIRDWGTCISCRKPITMENCDAGHFCPAANCGRDLLFSPENVHAECKGCNGFDSGHLLRYRRKLKARYGLEYVEHLEDRYDSYRESKTPVKDWTGAQYEEKIRELKRL